MIDRTDAVALSRPYQGRLRMTLTPPVINHATGRVVLTGGTSKAEALAGWLAGMSLPIARVKSTATVVFTDASAGVGR